MAKKQSLQTVAGFLDFIREQGIIGLAIGFILGGAVTKVVTSLVNDIINPFVGLVIGSPDSLKESKLIIGSAEILWGSFVTALIDFLIISIVVYVLIKIINIKKLDKAKDEAKK